MFYSYFDVKSKNARQKSAVGECRQSSKNHLFL